MSCHNKAFYQQVSLFIQEKLCIVTKEKDELVMKLEELTEANDTLNKSIANWKKEIKEREFNLENEKKQNSVS